MTGYFTIPPNVKVFSVFTVKFKNTNDCLNFPFKGFRGYILENKKSKGNVDSEIWRVFPDKCSVEAAKEFSTITFV